MLESRWATYVVGLPHAISLRTPEAGIAAAVCALGCDAGDTVLLVGDAPVYVRMQVHGVPVASLADCCSDRPGAVGVIVSHPAEGRVPWYDDLVRWCMREGLWVIEDCGSRLDVGRASHAAVWSLVGGIVATLDDGVALRMREWRARTGYGMTVAQAEEVLRLVSRG